MLEHPARTNRVVLVSIHAPRCRGAMRGCPGGLHPGDVVSIHAPRCRGAMPLDRGVELLGAGVVSIHAPRCRGAMRDSMWSICVSVSFNPRSPLPGSDACARSPWSRVAASFNPRSPLPGSDAGCSSASASFWPRFNPRSPLPGSDAAEAHGVGRGRAFQSTLPVAGERCPTSFCPTAPSVLARAHS